MAAGRSLNVSSVNYFSSRRGRDVETREKQIWGSGGSLEPPGPLPMHLHTVYMACSECLPTRLDLLAEKTCFSQVSVRPGTWPTAPTTAMLTMTHMAAGWDWGLEAAAAYRWTRTLAAVLAPASPGSP